MMIKQVNQQGIELLKAWILATSKEDDAGPVCHVDQRAMDAWCQEAETAMANGSEPAVEMSQFHTQSGRPETFIIPQQGISEIEIDE